MIFRDRCDGTRVTGQLALNALMPYMMRGRNESAVYYEKEINIENALAYLKKLKMAQETKADQDSFTLFGLIITAALKTMALYPRLNRFIHRKALYQRKYIAFSFIVKQRFDPDAPEVNAKIFFEPDDPFQTVSSKINAAILDAREQGKGDGERFANIFHKIPGGKALMMTVYRFLEYFNIAPWGLIRMDPLYSSVYFANLGSIGLNAPYHHLYEWGNTSIFLVIGKMFSKELWHGGTRVRQRYIDLRVTLDERIADGYLFAEAASAFYRMLSHPELLELPLDTLRGAFD
jgi:hypothetical protein